MTLKKSITFLCLIILAGKSFGQKRWTYEFNLGLPYNFPTTILIHQSGFEDLKITNANFYSEPFALPPYWDWKFSQINKKRILELEAIHHKLYLSNRPSIVRRFSISHGFNMFFLNFGSIQKNNLIIKGGLGAVFTHPETNIRELSFEDQGEFLNTTYYLSGPVINISMNKRWYLLKRIYFNSEFKVTAAYINIPISQGEAKFFTSSAQVIAGFGYDFISKE